jgi:hypothetical protein
MENGKHNILELVPFSYNRHQCNKSLLLLIFSLSPTIFVSKKAYIYYASILIKFWPSFVIVQFTSFIRNKTFIESS